MFFSVTPLISAPFFLHHPTSPLLTFHFFFCLIPSLLTSLPGSVAIIPSLLCLVFALFCSSLQSCRSYSPPFVSSVSLPRCQETPQFRDFIFLFSKPEFIVSSSMAITYFSFPCNLPCGLLLLFGGRGVVLSLIVIYEKVTNLLRQSGFHIYCVDVFLILYYCFFILADVFTREVIQSSKGRPCPGRRCL